MYKDSQELVSKKCEKFAIRISTINILILLNYLVYKCFNP